MSIPKIVCTKFEFELVHTLEVVVALIGHLDQVDWSFLGADLITCRSVGTVIPQGLYRQEPVFWDLICAKSYCKTETK